ncbi:hypothetical protein ABLE94_05370 [Gordonia sp. VNK1]|uniref:hypothetical protein n=1 Tax=Gordonia oleivorans TaxID=3156618 RepID=UPI0032B45472
MTPEEFWSRPSLAHVLAHARASMVSPWSLLGSVLARVIVSTGPDVVLPPIIGGPASLNLVVALVGSSAAGKDTTESAARTCTDLPDLTELPLGTGEGVGRTFAEPPAPRKDQPPAERIDRALLTATEVDTVAAIAARQGSTLLPTLRQLYSGSTLGAANSSPDRRVIVPAHTYRAAVIVGVQPERAGILAADTAGTRQRVLWMPTADHDTPDETPEPVAPLRVERSLRGRVLVVPDEVADRIRAHRRAVLREDSDVDLGDGHRMLTRLKVAAGLMLLDSRHTDIEMDDWALAGAIMRVSDRTRARVDSTLSDKNRRANRAKAHAVAERDEVVADRKLARAKEAVIRWLDRRGELPANEIRSKLKADLRDYFGAAVAELVESGQVTETKVDRGSRFRLGEVQGVPGVHPPYSQVRGGVPKVQGVPEPDEPPGETPPGGITPTTPGMTDRVLEILNGRPTK